jgi:hypothetical protein
MENKKLKWIIIAVLLFVGFKITQGARPIAKSMSVKGDQVTISYKDDVVFKANRQPAMTERFLVNNDLEDRRSDGGLFVIPLARAEALKAQYGDFMHCDSPGASAGKESLQRVLLITDDPQVREKIKKVSEKAENSPIVEIKGSRLDIVEQQVKGRGYEEVEIVLGGSPPPKIYYLIDDIRIVRENYE